MSGLQTILGAGGSIGLELARILPDYSDRVRLVSRNPKKLLPSNEPYAADLLNARQVAEAVKGSDVAYLVAGLPYSAKIWESQWPVVMRNTIAACRASGCKLVFFDNVYMYDRNRLAPMDETTPVRPTSRKGTVRARIAQELMDAVARSEIDGLIAQIVFKRLSAGKAAQWLLSADRIHSFTYTPDAARATAMLGNTDDAYGGVWHLPTAANPPTGRQWIEAIARELGVEARVQVVSGPLMSILGLVYAPLRELKEMAYQYDRDYDFVSEKFNRRFDFEPTSYVQGIRAVLEADYP
jgi:nucleoside-diphosphate-sugar epimerase